jgi:hypothetical protein
MISETLNPEMIESKKLARMIVGFLAVEIFIVKTVVCDYCEIFGHNKE